MNSNARYPNRLASIFMLMLFTHQGLLHSQVPEKVHCRTALQINYASEIPPHLIPSQDAGYYGWLNLTNIFPQQNLTGVFSIKNITTDTLKLAPIGQPLLQYLHLAYSYRGDSTHVQSIVPIQITESIAFSNNEKLPSYGQINYLPPDGSVGVYIDCLWDNLAKLEPRIVEFQYIYDNSAVAYKDTSIALTIFQSRIDTFKLKTTLDNRLDSIYFYIIQAENQYDLGNLQSSIDFCKRILQLDSANFIATRKITDALWRLQRFEDAELYAQKGIDLLQNPPPPDSLTVTLGNERYLLTTMQKRLELIKKREEWRSVDYPTE
ncbi:MAG: hypothetical protein NTW14_01460 [bacterium]|nr:hypothetical protein [bacterium]